MQSIFTYFNQEETKLIYNLECQKKSINKQRGKLIRQFKTKKNVNLKHKKYINNLKRQTKEIKDTIDGLKLERISEQIFYEEKFINENNINSLNKDVLQVIRDLDFGGTEYLFVKDSRFGEIKISTNIEETTTLLKEGWVSQIYKGKYSEDMCSSEMMKTCELIFDKDSMLFKKTNKCDIRSSNDDIYSLNITFEKSNGRISENVYKAYSIRDMGDYDMIEEAILQEVLPVVGASIASIDSINDEYIDVSHCFSIEKRTLYNKCNMNLSNNPLCYELHGRLNQLINKDKPEINWDDCLDFDSDIEME